MPWIPELFSEPVLARFVEEKRQQELPSVPFFDGLVAGELDALVGSFAGEPVMHHPVRGRIRGAQAFERYVIETNMWLRQRNISVEDVERVVAQPRGFEEVVLHLNGENGRIDLPVAIVAEKQPDGRIDELRMYYSSWPLTGRHLHRPPLMQPDPKVHVPSVVAEYLHALSAGDLDATLSSFEPDAYVREPAGGRHAYAGPEGLRTFFGPLFSNGGGIPLERCSLIDDGRTCALEFNVARWGKTEMPPEAGVVVFVRGQNGGLAAVRIYDDADRRIESPGRLAA